MGAAKKERADQLLVTHGLAETRSRARALIMAGEVFSGDRRIEKAGEQLATDAPLFVRERQKYVSRGGLKLEGALHDFELDPHGWLVADVGASTGGFSDCVLQRGAQRVFAIDVGHGQLAEKLRQDPRVVTLERTNARHLTQDMVEGGVDLAVVDASFIGLGKLLPALASIVEPEGFLLALIKPQFEVGRREAERHGGVIRDEGLRQEAIDRVLFEVERHGFSVEATARCRIAGPKGNVEHFCLARRRRTAVSPE